jgi:3',5'-nucleoside bisphosphate phosphatase
MSKNEQKISGAPMPDDHFAPTCQVDLHMHSSISDGGKTPSEVMQYAADYGVCVVSLTDHNTIDGLEEAQEQAESLGMRFIPGIEIDTTYHDLDWHILGYGIDPSNKQLTNTLRELQDSRREAAQITTEKLASIGFHIQFQEVLDTGSHSLSKYHIVKVMMRRKSNRDRVFKEIHPYPDIFEIIEMYMGPGREASASHTQLPAQEIIRLISQAGGIPVISHPGVHHQDWDLHYPIDEVIRELVAVGAKGIEAISPKHNPPEIHHFTELAKELGVIVTGGTDYHGVHIPGVREEPFRSMPMSIYHNLRALLTSS